MMVAIDGYFTRHDISYRTEDGTVVLQGPQTLGLANIVQMCCQIPESAYGQMIDGQFDSIFVNETFLSQLDLNCFEQIEQYLAVRLHDDEYLSHIPADWVDVTTRPFAGNLRQTLVLDFPTAIVCVDKDSMEHWGKPADELFTRGIDNVKQNYDWPIGKADLAGQPYFIVETEHFFAGNLLFDLDSHPELLGAHGAVVAVPTRSVVVLYPINGPQVIGAFAQLASAVTHAYEAGPGSLTTQVCWYHDGQFVVLPYDVAGTHIRFFPPDEFTGMLNFL